ncbi:MAG: methyltransferase [Pseudomonadota bacterium]
MSDDDRLAKAYNRGLELEKAGDLEGAAEAYAEVLKLDPADHGGVSVRLAAIGLGDVPDAAPDAYIATLFDQNAAKFDDMLVEQLGYAVPMLVRERLGDLCLTGPFPRMLDLGCGTGLTGTSMRDLADEITGVDLSENMLDEAHERDCYAALYVAEAVAFLEESGEGPWDLIAATDVLPYRGALERFFLAAARETRPGGLLVYSCETLTEDELGGRDYTVSPKHRFAHAWDYLTALMAASFETRHREEITVRYDDGAPVPGYLIIAERCATPD